MNKYLLFEVGVEELPSRFVSSTLDQIKSNLTKMFNENRIEFSNKYFKDRFDFSPKFHEKIFDTFKDISEYIYSTFFHF